MDVLQTLTAAGLDVTVLQQRSTGTVRLGWQEPDAIRLDDLPTVTGAGPDDLVTTGEPLGEGGMAIVLSGHQRGLGRPVATMALAALVDMELRAVFMVMSWIAACTWFVGALTIERLQLFGTFGHLVGIACFYALPTYAIEIAGCSVLFAHSGMAVLWIARAGRAG